MDPKLITVDFRVTLALGIGVALGLLLATTRAPIASKLSKDCHGGGDESGADHGSAEIKEFVAFAHKLADASQVSQRAVCWFLHLDVDHGIPTPRSQHDLS